jgi:hypothetical protein
MTYPEITIESVHSHQTIDFAIAELRKYLQQMIAPMTISSDGEARRGKNGVSLQVGLYSDFPTLNLPETPNPDYDDAIFIDVQAGTGIIAGINPRSCLIAAYRFLTELGCRWIRPGKDGEWLPRKDFSELTAHVNEKPSYRHRGICIEGAVSYENVVAIIDWIPKVGLNAYFIQFRQAYAFFERWYTHCHNPLKPSRPFAPEEAQVYVNQAEQEIQKRSLIYHAVGHGWTCEPLGIPGLSWDQKVFEVSPDITPYLAMVGGKRGLWGDVPLNTNLCYSNPDVRKIVINDVIQYVRKHNIIDFIHIWLADSKNNQCECPECQKALPSDFYIQLLNELDERLSSENLPTKVVFLIYVDLLWPPEVQQIQNPERFLLMFAPITRSYDYAFKENGASSPISNYTRNQLKFPKTVAENLAYLKAWQKIFNGDSFSFDYHLMWAHYFDWGYIKIARIIHEDIKELKNMNLHGFISCQVQRCFAPTGLPNYVLAKTLWNAQLSFDETVHEYFQTAFGSDGKKCYHLLSEIPDLMNEIEIWMKDYNKDTIIKKLHQMDAVLKRIQQLTTAHQQTNDHVRNQSWKYLQFSIEAAMSLRNIFLARAEGKRDETAVSWEQLKNFIQAQEEDLQSVFDVYEFIQTMEKMNPLILNLHSA